MSRVERIEYIYVYVHLYIYVIYEGFYVLFFSQARWQVRIKQ